MLLLDEEDLERNGNFLRHLSQVAPSTRILVMATRSSKEKLESVRHDGACGIVEMGSNLETLVRAIEAVAAGKVWAHRSTAAPGPEHREPVRSKLPVFGTDGRLTKREWEIAERVGRGLRNRDIAVRLNISQETVKTHLNNIFRKLQLDGRVAGCPRHPGSKPHRTEERRMRVEIEEAPGAAPAAPKAVVAVHLLGRLLEEDLGTKSDAEAAGMLRSNIRQLHPKA